jgi:arsenate reductase
MGRKRKLPQVRKADIDLEADMPAIMYGIANCDTVKRARDWLTQQGIEFAFQDYKKAGVDRATVEQWVEEHGWEVVLNRAGMTFKKLPDADKGNLDGPIAIELMLAQPSMIKRPILDLGDRRIVGFKPEIYEAALRSGA